MAKKKIENKQTIDEIKKLEIQRDEIDSKIKELKKSAIKKDNEFDKQIKKIENNIGKIKFTKLFNKNFNIDIVFCNPNSFNKEDLLIDNEYNLKIHIEHNLYKEEEEEDYNIKVAEALTFFNKVNESIANYLIENKINFDLSDNFNFSKTITISLKNASIKEIIHKMNFDDQIIKDIIDNIFVPDYQELIKQSEMLINDLNLIFK